MYYLDYSNPTESSRPGIGMYMKICGNYYDFDSFKVNLFDPILVLWEGGILRPLVSHIVIYRDVSLTLSF